MVGSPPRAWGLGDREGFPKGGFRFTPTGVGTGLLQLLGISYVPVHPHGRGDWPRPVGDAEGVPGSPPRAWGLAGFLRYKLGRKRFTPTGVGTGRERARRQSIASVHPHGRGDWQARSRMFFATGGSPPRAWGLEGFQRFNQGGQRFTPTGVGTGFTARVSPGLFPVHPHGRGDWPEAKVSGFSLSGSPPRAWGLVKSALNAGSSKRFTPTGVGTGARSRSLNFFGPVHPHGRGDWLYNNPGKPKLTGSPPRAWGLGSGGPEAISCLRFTPTGVGTGLPGASLLPYRAVHPHGRGDWHLRLRKQ